MMIEDEELRNLYQISSEERLQNLEAGWQHLQKQPDDETILEELRREAHSLKGDSISVGVEAVETVTYALEEILLSIKRQQTALTPQISDRFYQGLEAISLLVREAVSGEPSGIDTRFVSERLMQSLVQPEQPQQQAVSENAQAFQLGIYDSQFDGWNGRSEEITAQNQFGGVPGFIEDEELRDIYKIASEERLQNLKAGLLHLEKHPDDETTLEQLRREIHSLKGDSRSVGVDTVETLTHQVEEIFISIKRQETVLTPLLSDRLYQGLDAIGLLVGEAVTGEPSGVDTTEVIEQLIQAVFESQVPQPQAIPENGKIPQPILSFIDDEELRNLYQTTSEQRLQKLEAGLQHLQQQPDDETTLEELRREVHSLKGDSRSVGVDTVETLAHALEDVLKGIKRQEIVLTPLLSDRFSQGLEAISLLVWEAVSGEPSGVDTTFAIEQLMEAVLEGQESQPEAVSENGKVPQTEFDARRGRLEETTHQNQLGGVLAPTFIEDEELRDIYKIACEERLQKLEAGLLHLEKHPNDNTTLEELLREAHSLKGDSRSAGVDPAETLIHEIEEILLGIKRQQTTLTRQVSDRLYQGLDAIGLLVREAVTGQFSGVDVAKILKQLQEVVPAPALEESVPVPAEPVSPPAETPVIQTSELPSPPPGVAEPYRIDTIRVHTRELDALMSQAEELIVTKIRIAHATAAIEEMAILWDEWKAFNSRGKSLNASSSVANPYQQRLENIINSLRNSTQENSSRLDMTAGELREKIRTLRLLPLSTVFQLFPRMVRDLARQQSKEVELIIEGGETTADKQILEEIKDSLMHMIRNAIDHGIETAAEREALGKPPAAKIWLRGYHTAHNIVIEVADDGRGLDIEKIKQTAIKRRIYRPEELETMTPSQIYSLIFAPGFSTRTFITAISGRGIGLDVVRTNIERLKGNIQIESTPGQGCTFRIQLRTTLATVNALLVQVHGIIHALPIEFVETTLLVSQEQKIFTAEGYQAITWGDRTVPVANLADVLELSNSPAYASTAKFEQQTSDLQSCILVKVGEEYSGFFVDRLLDTQEVVLKPQSQLLRRVRNVTGATILPSGEVCTILNPPDLIRSLQKQTRFGVSIKPKETVQRKPVILLVEDSIPVRTQEKRLLEKAGYEVVIAVNGLDGYNKLKTRDFDAVVSDVEMPLLDGFSLTAKIRQYPEYEQLPIILVTTLDTDEAKRKGAEAGADAYILKGKFNQDFLLETLGRLV